MIPGSPVQFKSGFFNEVFVYWPFYIVLVLLFYLLLAMRKMGAHISNLFMS